MRTQSETGLKNEETCCGNFFSRERAYLYTHLGTWVKHRGNRIFCKDNDRSILQSRIIWHTNLECCTWNKHGKSTLIRRKCRWKCTTAIAFMKRTTVRCGEVQVVFSWLVAWRVSSLAEQPAIAKRNELCIFLLDRSDRNLRKESACALVAFCWSRGPQRWLSTVERGIWGFRPTCTWVSCNDGSSHAQKQMRKLFPFSLGFDIPVNWKRNVNVKELISRRSPEHYVCTQQRQHSWQFTTNERVVGKGLTCNFNRQAGTPWAPQRHRWSWLGKLRLLLVASLFSWDILFLSGQGDEAGQKYLTAHDQLVLPSQLWHPHYLGCQLPLQNVVYTVKSVKVCQSELRTEECVKSQKTFFKAKLCTRGIS